MRTALVWGGLAIAIFAGLTGRGIAALSPQTWFAPNVGRSEELIYLSGPNGVYIYRRHPPFDLVGFILVSDQDVVTGPAIDAQRNVYAIDVDFGSRQTAVVDKFSRTAHGFKLVEQFPDADFGQGVKVGPDGTVYVVGNDGGILEYAPGGGPPIVEIDPPGAYMAEDVAIDVANNVFVSFQFISEDRSRYSWGHGSAFHRAHAAGLFCGRGSDPGQINEYRPHSTIGRCIRGSPAVTLPDGIAFDSMGNLLVSDQYLSDIRVLSPPDWTVTQKMTQDGRIPGRLAFSAADRLYDLTSIFSSNDYRMVETSYPSGSIIHDWRVPLPFTEGIAAEVLQR